MSDPTATQQAAIEASVGSAQRIAMRIIALPKEQREAALEIVRRNYADAIKRAGFGDSEQSRKWIELQMQGIRALIAEIEMSGGGHGGVA
jgi:hypothetical protein